LTVKNNGVVETEAKKENGMNRDDIIRMAREAGIPETETQGVFIANSDDFGRFAAVVEERLKWDGIHSCHAECNRPACVNMRKAVEAEREACLEWCAAYASDDGTAQKIIAAIRARGSNV